MSTSLSQVRTKVRTVAEALKATWTDFPLVIEYDDEEKVNFETQTLPFLRIMFQPMGGNQADLAKRPIHRVPFMLNIEAWHKVNSGNLKSDKLLDHFYRPFQMSDQNYPLRTFAAQLLPRKSKGWGITLAAIPGWYDDFPA